jgi:hypothetical protein
MIQTLLLGLLCALPGGEGDLGLPLSLKDAPAREEADELGLEVGSWVGIVGASSDFESDPELAVGLTVRLPLPLIGGEDLGVFVQGALTKVDRDLYPEPENPDGNVYAFAAGLDYTLFRTSHLMIRLQVGVQYVKFDDIFEADDGVSLLGGGVVGLAITDSLWLTANPQIWLGEGGDYLWLAGAGIMLVF